MSNQLSIIQVSFKPVTKDSWQAIATLPPFIEDDAFNFVPCPSPVVGDIGETLYALCALPLIANYRTKLVCIKCHCTESREYDVSEETGICEHCAMSQEERDFIAQKEYEDEMYVFGPMD